MNHFFRWTLFLPLLMGWLMPAGDAFGQPQTTPAAAVVRAVLFYSPTCGHCHYVIEEVLPPLMSHYGERLQIVGVDVATKDGFNLFQAAWNLFGLESSGVPFLVVGDAYLIGSADIPEKFPDIIEYHLARDGVDWPAIPGLAEAVQAAQSQPTAAQPPTATVMPTAASIVTASEQPATPEAVRPAALALTSTPEPLPPTATFALVPANPISSATPPAISGLSSINQPPGGPGEKFQRDLVGNGLAVFVLLGMVLSLGAGVRGLSWPFAATLSAGRRLAIPFLCLIGMGVAGYLAYVEMTQSLAVCGPVGDCNTVQQSEYARLFGILPIGVLGILGYLGILSTWLVTRFGSERWARLAVPAMVGMIFFGVLFSIYLTFLEPFVIGATCAWCLSSAVIMTALLWLALPLRKSESNAV